MFRRLMALTLFLAGATAPAAQAFSFDSVSATRSPAGMLALSWVEDGPVDVYVSAAQSASTSRMRKISDNDLDGRHSWHVGPQDRPFILLRAEKTGETIRLAERLLPLQGGSNFRDVGGYPAAGGKHVRWGLIYRSGAMPRLTATDQRAVSRLHIRSLVDLRSTDERQISPTNWKAMSVRRYTAVDYPASDLFGGPEGRPVGSLYEAWPVSLKRQYRQIFDDLLAGKGPVAYNCSAGQDRTGVATALVLSALGVPRSVIIADYHLSTTYRRPENEMAEVEFAKLAATNPFPRYYAELQKLPPAARRPQPLLTGAGEARLMDTFRKIEADYGSVERYFDQELGVDAADIARLRALYLE